MQWGSMLLRFDGILEGKLAISWVVDGIPRKICLAGYHRMYVGLAAALYWYRTYSFCRSRMFADVDGTVYDWHTTYLFRAHWYG